VHQSGEAKFLGHEESDSDSDDSDYVPCSDDSGEDEETVHLRKFVKMYKKKLKDSQKFVQSEETGAVPIDLMANVEEVIEQRDKEAEYDSGSEDFSYDEASDGEGKFVRRRTL
jgi:rubrerythrin